MEHHGTTTSTSLVAYWRERHDRVRYLRSTSMSNGKPCEAHHIPADICARCKGAAEERDRIVQMMKDNENWFNIQDVIDALESDK